MVLSAWVYSWERLLVSLVRIDLEVGRKGSWQ